MSGIVSKALLWLRLKEIENSVTIRPMGREEVLKSWFFKAPVRVDGQVVAAPPSAIEKRDALRRKWLPFAKRGWNEALLVKLTPVFKVKPTGWKVETAVRYKNDSIPNPQP